MHPEAEKTTLVVKILESFRGAIHGPGAWRDLIEMWSR